ncbi:GGDEF domain-containing protein [Tepidiforma sp.]|uniref:GGDEF domain-containing protein n=1 Tax=Tepidiforma sp. TaxID=2682230 RepID=UPI002ADE835F|nr:GGDEF domain-containing protein [Tepidiforma sp.]
MKREERWAATAMPARPGLPATERAKLEMHVMALQGAIAAFFVAGELLGWFGNHPGWTRAAVGWVAGFHLVRTLYVVRWRARGRPIPLVENTLPLFDVSCVTAGMLVLNDPFTPFWAVYLYALVGYARRYHGVPYLWVVLLVVANVAGVQAVTRWRHDAPVLSWDFGAMVVLTAMIGALAHAVGAGWREAERQARVLAETDGLTGLANRRHFLDVVEQDAERWGGYAILMMDIDDFKRLNDEHGHLHGDAVLERVAAVLRAHLRDGDLLARYGGEEFVVAMPGADLATALVVAERLRSAVMRLTPSSISVGCAVRQPGESLDQVLRRADDLLLSAKRTGKNVVRWEPVRRRGPGGMSQAAS